MFEDAANRTDAGSETLVAGKRFPYLGFILEGMALAQIKHGLPVLPGPLSPTLLSRAATACLKSLPTLLAIPFPPTVADGLRPVDGVQAQWCCAALGLELVKRLELFQAGTGFLAGTIGNRKVVV